LTPKAPEISCFEDSFLSIEELAGNTSDTSSIPSWAGTAQFSDRPIQITPDSSLEAESPEEIIQLALPDAPDAPTAKVFIHTGAGIFQVLCYAKEGDIVEIQEEIFLVPDSDPVTQNFIQGCLHMLQKQGRPQPKFPQFPSYGIRQHHFEEGDGTTSDTD
jgi:hypothetical protein